MSYQGNDPETAMIQVELLTKLLLGIAEKEDVSMYVALLNGPTVDKVLQRTKANPCGCKGK